jgi:cobalt-zinc-cadmium efflux system protein
MNQTHHHTHAHASSVDRRERRLLIAFALTLVTLVAEAVGGWLSGSLALLADAGHMLVDAAALMFAWLGVHYAQRPADARRSFGYARLEVLVGYSNALVQFVLVAWIVVEALMRLGAPQPIESGIMLVVASGGLLVNAFVLFALSGHDHSGHEHAGHDHAADDHTAHDRVRAHADVDDDVNTAAARLHVLGDLFGSLGAIAAALLIRWQGWLWSDPAMSILVSLLILSSAWRLLRRCGHILLEGAPEGIDAELVSGVLRREATGVHDVHHVHVWQLAGGYHVATLHARLDDGVDADAAIGSIRGVLRERFRVHHATVQLERFDCADVGCGK